ncbi:MAG: amino acid adenylation domain-containing protein [Acidimicrobiales bacterium]
MTGYGGQGRDRGNGALVDRFLLRHARRHPGSQAIEDDEVSMSYGELSERVGAAAAKLVDLGVRPGDRVALWLSNSAGFVVAALACLWVGAPFVPLSTQDPRARTARILDDCMPKLLLARRRPGERPGAGLQSWGRVRVVDVEEILAAGAACPPPPCDGAGRDAYIIYTSGTTGQPKGVRISGRALGSAISVIARAMGLRQATRSLCVSSFHFDGSYGTLFPTLWAGGCLVVPDREAMLFPKHFFNAVADRNVTHTGFSPSYLRLLLSSSHLGRLEGSVLRSLGLGGEECVPEDVARLWQVLPALRVFNRYGPTEATIEVATYEITPGDVEADRVPIGEPHEGVTFYLLDEDGQPVGTPRRTGELYIGGRQLMEGYWADDELNGHVLRQDVVAGELVYRTGDLVWRDEAGRYFYAGRADDVVKRNGVRISLSEVALALRRVGKISGAVCLLSQREGYPIITAYVEAASEMTAQAVFEVASTRLPASMLPDEVVLVPSLPLTTSGKVDRDRLVAPTAPEGGGQRWSETAQEAAAQ